MSDRIAEIRGAAEERKRIVEKLRERAASYHEADERARKRSAELKSAGRQKRLQGDNHAAAIARVLNIVADELERDTEVPR